MICTAWFVLLVFYSLSICRDSPVIVFLGFSKPSPKPPDEFSHIWEMYL